MFLFRSIWQSLNFVFLSREQQKKISALELELTAARQEGFLSKRSTDVPQKRPLLVIGVFTTFAGKRNRDAVRKQWMGTGIMSTITDYFLFYFACCAQCSVLLTVTQRSASTYQYYLWCAASYFLILTMMQAIVLHFYSLRRLSFEGSGGKQRHNCTFCHWKKVFFHFAYFTLRHCAVY